MRLLPSDAFDAPVFVVGAQRSGTTLLRLMLTAHPAISIPPESLFMVRLAKTYGTAKSMQTQIDRFVDDLYADKKFNEWSIDQSVLEDHIANLRSWSYADVVAQVYKTYADMQHPGASIWGDKNPRHIFHVDMILNMFAKARIVHIIRGVQAIYNSVQRKALKQFGKPLDNQLALVTDRWTQVAKIFNAYKDHPNVYTMYYERLVARPEMELRRLCSYLSIPYHASMLSYHIQNAAQGLVPEHRLAWHQGTLRPPDTTRVDGWKHELTRSEIETVEVMNAAAMAALEYRPCVDLTRD